jgi:transposase
MPAPKKYSDELRERAVRMVFDVRRETGQTTGTIARVADQLGVLTANPTPIPDPKG